MWQFSIFIGNRRKHKTADIWRCANEEQCVPDKTGCSCRTITRSIRLARQGCWCCACRSSSPVLHESYCRITSVLPRLLTPISAARWRTPSINVGLNYLRIFQLLQRMCLNATWMSYWKLQSTYCFIWWWTSGWQICDYCSKQNNNKQCCGDCLTNLVSPCSHRHEWFACWSVYLIWIICRIFVESKYVAIWLLTWLSCCRVGNVIVL